MRARSAGRPARLGAALLLSAAVTACAGLFAGRSMLLGYLWAYIFWLGLSLGALELLFLWRLTGGAWCAAIGPGLEALAGRLPALSIMSLPLLLCGAALYPWMGGPAPNGYLKMPFFALRLFVYAAVWSLLALAYERRSAAGAAMEGFAGTGCILLLLTCTFSAIDWVMSLSMGWVSTAYGLIFVVGYALSALAAVSLGLSRRQGPSVQPERIRDLSKLLFTIIVLHLYLHYSQYLIYWMGDIPDRISWYFDRSGGAAAVVSFALLAFYIGLPGVLLLFFGGDSRVLYFSSALLLMFRGVEIGWLILPARSECVAVVSSAVTFAIMMRIALFGLPGEAARIRRLSGVLPS